MCCLILLDADAKEYYNSAEQIVPVGRPQEQRSHHHCSSISGISNITATQCSGGARALCVTCDGGDGGKFQSFCNCSIVPISHSLSCSFSNPTTRYKRICSFIFIWHKIANVTYIATDYWSVWEQHALPRFFLVCLQGGSDSEEDEREDPRDVAQLRRTWQSRQGEWLAVLAVCHWELDLCVMCDMNWVELRYFYIHSCTEHSVFN